MEIKFVDFDQWGSIKDRISRGFIPCPVCDQWTNDIRVFPERLMRYEPFFKRERYACVYCIASASNKKREIERESKIPKCYHTHKHPQCVSGFVYFLDCSNDGDNMVKIGTARTMKNVRARLIDAKRTYGLSCAPTLIRVVETNCGISLEKYIHGILGNKRLYREMFVLDDESNKYISNLSDYIEVVKGRDIFDLLQCV